MLRFALKQQEQCNKKKKSRRLSFVVVVLLRSCWITRLMWRFCSQPFKIYWLFKMRLVTNQCSWSKIHPDTPRIKTGWLVLFISMATRPCALMGIATQRAMALGLLMGKLLNPSSSQSASEAPRCLRAGAHSALVLIPTQRLLRWSVWDGGFRDSARSLPAVW